jgi:hypothetical protein
MQSANFTGKMLQNLWLQTVPNEKVVKNAQLVVSSAFEELGKFDKLQFKCSYLPEFVIFFI